jgi:hypothetical protein
MFRKALTTTGIALAVVLGTVIAPAAAHADTTTGGLAGSGVSVGSTTGDTVDGGTYIDGLNTCKVKYVRTFQSGLAQCYVWQTSDCWYMKKVVTCTRY